MRGFDFSKIIYKSRNITKGERYITDLIGLDTETRPDGSPFLVCTSLGESFPPSAFPEMFFTRRYRGRNFGVYNIKFDSGSLLYHLPVAVLNELRISGKTQYKEYHYFYIPHKCLRVSRGKNAVTIWNIAQYFNMSLDAAARKYLKSSKIHIGTKKFTKRYIKKHYKEIVKYCIRDAALVSRLYTFMLEGLRKMRLYPTALYSTASLAFTYFKSKDMIYSVSRFWDLYRQLLQYACESYAGGKFEIYKRGRFDGVIYDINSAYPFEMSRLINIEDCQVLFSQKFLSGSTYAFMRVFIDNSGGASLPCPFKAGTLSIYPLGRYYLTITLNEYLYLTARKIPVKFLSGWFIFANGRSFAYKPAVLELHRWKTQYKGKDERQYKLAKICMNGFYGKLAQLIPQEDGSIRAGVAWHPIYASVITANTRIRISEMYERYRENVLAVHTDSILMNRPIDQSYLGHDLGSWEKQIDGPGLLVACGIYQIADKLALRGFNPLAPPDLFKLCRSMGNNAVTWIKSLNVKSWTECAFRNKHDLINRFMIETKRLDLNSEKKRIWGQATSGKMLLKGLQPSAPRVTL